MRPPRDAPRVERSDLTTLARDLLRGGQDAEDIAHEVWLLHHRQAGRVRDVSAWLRVAALHLVMRGRRRDRQRAQRERIVARPDLCPSVLEQLEQESQRQRLATLVSQLPAPYREVVRMRYLEDCTLEEVAVFLRRSPGTVRSQLKRGLDRLRKRLAETPDHRERAWLLCPWTLLRDLAGRLSWERVGPRSATAACVVCSALLVSVLATSGPRTPSGGPPVASRPGAAPHAGFQLAGAPSVPSASTDAPLSDPSDPVDYRLQMDAGVWASDVEGDVLSPDGAPVPRAPILVGIADGSVVRVAGLTDARGHYSLRGVDCRLLIWAEAPGQVPSSRHFLGSKRPGAELDLRLGPRIGTERGRVVAPGGEPLPRVEVTQLCSPFVEPNMGYRASDQGTLMLGPRPLPARMAEDGSLLLSQGFDGRFRLLVTAEGHAPWVSPLQDPSAEGTLEFVLPGPCTLTGRLLRPGGHPAAGVRLELVLPSPFSSPRTTTDESGGFHFAALPEGPHVLRLASDPTGATASCFLTGGLASGESAWLEATLREGLSIRGRALDGETPLPNRIVELQPMGRREFWRRPRRLRTSPDGSFSFLSCAPTDDHMLRLLGRGPHDGTVALVQPVRAGDDRVLLRPRDSAGTSLAGRFHARTKERMPVMAVLRGDTLGEPMLLRVDPGTGVFVAETLPAGNHDLRAWVPGVGVWNGGRVEVLPGRTTTFVARVPEPGTLRLTVELPPAASSESLLVRLGTIAFHDSLGKTSTQRLQERDGRGRLAADLFPGRYHYTVFFEEALYESRHPVEVESGQVTAVELSLVDVVPMTLRLQFCRPLRLGERVSLSVLEADGERRTPVEGVIQGGAMKLRVALALDTRELQVQTSLGLRATLALTEADLVREGALSVALVAD